MVTMMLNRRLHILSNNILPLHVTIFTITVFCCKVAHLLGILVQVFSTATAFATDPTDTLSVASSMTLTWHFLIIENIFFTWIFKFIKNIVSDHG
jgi:hypothetical protein